MLLLGRAAARAAQGVALRPNSQLLFSTKKYSHDPSATGLSAPPSQVRRAAARMQGSKGGFR